MGLFENIQKFGNTFFSIRKHDGYFIIDLNFPSHWTYNNLYDADKIAVKVNTSTTDGTLVSFYCVDNLEGVKFLENEILSVIKINKDTEEKNRLLTEKTRELEQLFQSKNLDELKDIKFNMGGPLVPILNKKKNNEQFKQKPELVEEGKSKGPQRS